MSRASTSSRTRISPVAAAGASSNGQSSVNGSTSMTPDRATAWLKQNNVKFVLAQLVDIHGVAKAKAVPVSHFDDILTDGAGFAGFALWGIGQEPHDPDYMAVGDLSTLHLCPHQPGFARIVCYGTVRKQKWPFDTRWILRQQMDRMT